MMQSLNGSFCSGHTNSLGISRCFSPLQNRNVTQSNKSEISGPHILFLLPSSYNSWYGVTDDSDSVASLYRQWCNKGWLWCFNQIESRFKVSGELNTKDEDLLQFLVHLRDYDPSICDETTYSCSKKLLARLVDKSKSHEFNSLRADEEATSKVIHHQKFNNTESEKSNMKSSQHGSPTEINDSEISTPTVFKSSIAQKPQTFVSPLMKVNTVNPTSPLKVANDKRSTKTDNSEQSDAEPMQTARSPQNFTSSSSINTPICSPSKTPTGSIHHILPTLSCSLVGFYNSLQSTAGVQVSHTVAVDQTHSSTHLQDSCLSNLISVWQTLVSGLSCQLAETKAELMRTRELNEQLSKQLNQTSKQLSEAVDKFLEIEKNNRVISKNPTETPVPSTTTSVLETPIGELSKAITELRQWLPEGMASAACAAVSARLTTVHAKSLGQHQSPSHSESFVQANNTEKSPEKLKSSTIVSSSKSQDEDAEQFPEAYEPTMNFKPVLETLPDLVELKSGEENEQRLFCERARLFHWDKESESWKTKGIGEVRILKNLNTGKCRLVMGRDQVKKLCANHCITSSTKLSPSTKDPRMTMWAAKDYSESMEGVDEVFMIQFKSTETLNEFSRVFSECTAKIDGNAIAEFSSEVKYKSFEKNLPVTQSQAPSAAGVQLTSSAPKPPITESNNKTQASKQVDSILSKFAPKSGSWECPTCLLYHDSSVSLCSACQTPKPGSMGEANIITSKANTSTPLFGGFLKSAGGFVFGHSKASESTVSVTASTTSITTTTTPKPVFSFVSTSPKLNTNIFPTTSSQTSLSKSFTFTSSATTMTISSSFGHTFPSVFPTTLSTSETKPALQTSVSTTTTSGQSGFTFSFGDALSKLNQSSKLPTSVPTPTHGDSHVDENGDDDKVELVDDSKLTFKPVLEVIPKKIEVVTGEENDEVIFCRRAKLYRWDDKTWHERGVGDLKLLRSTVTGVIRCLMRRDHVLKVCCNHAIGVGMQLKPLNTGGGRAWSWWAIDYSEQSDEVNQTNETDSSVLSGGKRETFAARFKLTEHSEEFRALFEEAVQAAENRLNTSQSSEKKPPKKETVDLDQQEEDTDSDVVVVELPLKVSSDQVSQARRLKLPDEFYSYENGEVTGEPEHLTAQEEAEEDALLEAAIRGYAKTTTDQSASDCSVTPTQLSKQSDTENKAITGLSSATYMFQSKGLIDFSALNAAVSKVDQPTWGSSTKTSVWSNVGAPLFAKPTGETDQNEEDPSGTEHDPHYEPIVALPKLAETKTGEEEELCIFLRRCRAYRYVDKEWKERGVGEIKVLVRPRTMPADAHYGPRDVVPLEYKLTDIGRARILMRRDQILKLCLNHPISVDLPVLKPMSQSASGNSLCWVGEDYSEGSGSLETLAVRFKFDTDANEFKAAVARAQSALKSS
ncbi:unnamed protein product [Heterobilharzia americana]|nr:unnamed protein product [Heterobilharzia americana]